MEYTHRMWGRILGLVFAVPAAYFVARGVVTRRLGTRLGLLFLMGGTQGLVGWWMVKSGLQVCASSATAAYPPPYTHTSACRSGTHFSRLIGCLLATQQLLRYY